ncbi:MAG: DUF1549 domain-containing protein [Pirellulaceae bacterium]|nr:DUF1549 domain-containing protein [Pirellulaceae bacterium]
MRAFRIYLFSCGFLALVPQLAANEPALHRLIDQHVVPSTGLELPLCSDADFLRRISIDLIGMPPSLDQAQAFLSDQDPQKRTKLVDQLLRSPDFTRHFTRCLDVMLMERRAATNVPQDAWHNYLHQGVVANKPWNLLIREILTADGDGSGPRAAARFYLDRQAEPNLITRDIGRIVFGRDLQCAQCHDHPLINDYYQADYQGLYAFFGPGYEAKKKVDDKDVAIYAERAGTDVKFTSVFITDTQRVTGARAIDGIEIDEPHFLPGDEYKPMPTGKIWAPPKFSRRNSLAQFATSGTNRAFNENIANRLWAQMMGRGLVNPIDLHHSSNPPSHPALMKLLGEQIAKMNFDMKAFLREISLSNTYQRSIDLPEQLLNAATQAEALVVQLTREHAVAQETALKNDEAHTTAAENVSAAEAALVPVVDEIDKARAALTTAQNKLAETQKQLDEAKNNLAPKLEISQLIRGAAKKAAEAQKTFADDATLSAAAQFFASRDKALADEVVALEKVVVEKNAAIQGPTDAVSAATSPAKAALEKAKPLRAVLRTEQESEVAARRKMIVAETHLQRLDARLTTQKKLASLLPLEQSMRGLSSNISTLLDSVMTDRKKLERYQEMATALKTTQEELGQVYQKAMQNLSVVKNSQTNLQQTLAALKAAIASTEIAKDQISEDLLLEEALNQLMLNASQLQVAVTKIKQSVDAQEVGVTTSRVQLEKAQQEHQAAIEQKDQQQKQLETIEASLTESQQMLAAQQSQQTEFITELAASWTADFTIADLKPLTPEQLCFSVMRATGVWENQLAAAKAELEKNMPFSPEDQKDPEKMLQRERDIEAHAWEKSKGYIAGFVQVYGNGAGQPQTDFFATADQALFVANGGVLNSWVGNGSLTTRITNEEDPTVAAEYFYLGLLSRMPTENEVQEVNHHLAMRAEDRKVAVQEIVWAILNSVEFRFNH